MCYHCLDDDFAAVDINDDDTVIDRIMKINLRALFAVSQVYKFILYASRCAFGQSLH